MKINIVIYSFTGNTFSVGEKLEKALISKGHTVQLERITADNDDPGTREPFILKNIPDPSPYDMVILGAPVQQLFLSRIMKAYLNQMPQMQGKMVAGFVTQELSKKWMGSSRSIRSIAREVEKKGARMLHSGIIQWGTEKREEQINDFIYTICGICDEIVKQQK